MAPPLAVAARLLPAPRPHTRRPHIAVSHVPHIPHRARTLRLLGLPPRRGLVVRPAHPSR